MKNQWIVVASASAARIFRRKSALEPLVQVAALAHPESRRHASALATDALGRQANDQTHGAQAFAPRSDPQRKEHQRFAREIAQSLDQGLAAGEFGALTVFSSKPFMGELRACLSGAVGERVVSMHDCDLSHAGIGEIEQRLATPDARR